MASRVSLSGSFSSDSPSPVPPGPPPRPQLRSIIVPLILGTAHGPIVQGMAGPSRSPAEAPAPWQTKQSWHRRADRPRSPPRRQGQRLRTRNLPAARPRPDSRLPAVLFGCCYNCGSDDGHISAECQSPTRCIRCGGNNHISRGCTRPRSSSPGSPPKRPPPALRRDLTLPPPPPGPPPPGALRLAPAPVVRAPSPPLGSLPPLPPGPPPAGAVRLGRSWSQVVAADSVESVAAPRFFVPVVPASPVAVAWEEPTDCCFLEAAEDLRAMEEELARAVIVTVIGSRPEVDLAEAARAIHEEFQLGPGDMSIRRFYPEDFLVLCKDVPTRNRLVNGGRVSTAQFALSLRPWLRQAHATGISMPVLVPLALRGIPANAWTRRTVEAVLWGLGIVAKVADSTARRDDMSAFRVWLRTDDPARIPPRHILVVEEQGRRAVRQEDGVADALWYPVEIVQEGPLLAPRSAAPGPPLPPSEEDAPDGGRGGSPRRGRSRSRRGGRPHQSRASPDSSAASTPAPPATQRAVHVVGDPGQ
ncbi:formin-like protein 5 [Triticum aestivum]|uniref:formin-like protein 5 n=1 Tax=Triticum aestivum TaxID=4565 RepID=UPI001D01BFAE|nr:formin-like protein 5 [Triticum aestivum]XP_044411184.1 formin-like protein 5 [Triticum aestivum]XP_044411185.1 formin-like protein 5 [Triticum aestivum]